MSEKTHATRVCSCIWRASRERSPDNFGVLDFMYAVGLCLRGAQSGACSAVSFSHKSISHFWLTGNKMWPNVWWKQQRQLILQSRPWGFLWVLSHLQYAGNQAHCHKFQQFQTGNVRICFLTHSLSTGEWSFGNLQLKKTREHHSFKATAACCLLVFHLLHVTCIQVLWVCLHQSQPEQRHSGKSLQETFGESPSEGPGSLWVRHQNWWVAGYWWGHGCTHLWLTHGVISLSPWERLPCLIMTILGCLINSCCPRRELCLPQAL